MIFSKKVHFLDLDLVDSGLQMGFWRVDAIKMSVLRAQEELWDRLLHSTVSNHRSDKVETVCGAAEDLSGHPDQKCTFFSENVTWGIPT